MPQNRKPENDASDDVPAAIARRAIGEVAASASGRIYTLLAAGLMAFAGVFLMFGWQFGPLAMVEAQQYKKFTSHVDARIVDSWIALEFDIKDVRNPRFWRASTNAAGCVVAEYDGDWGAPMRRAFCGTRVPFNESYPLANLHDITEGVPFVWARDEHGFVVPEIRVDPATPKWLEANVPDKFMHQKWPANTALEWLRLELDNPVDAAIAGWMARPPILPLSFDPKHPGDALPTGIIARRLEQGPFWPAMLIGFGIGLYIWFKATSLLPLLQNLTPAGRWILSALPLLTLPWWMDAFPSALSHFSHDIGGIVGEMFADIGRTDRLIASEPAQATLANGERLVWRLQDSVYSDTFGRMQFVVPNPPFASDKAALAALTASMTTQVRALDDTRRAELFANLERDKRADLKEVGYVFKQAAEEAAADPAASAAMRRAASRFLE